MKVLDLQCAHGHIFEGWFGSEEDFCAQHAGAQIHCPVCGNDCIAKRLSAPRLNLGDKSATPVAHSPADSVDLASAKTLQQQWLMACRQLAENTVDVGTAFAEEARRIHYGETTERAIRGQATLQETQSLLDEGIAVVPVLLPKGLIGPLQ